MLLVLSRPVVGTLLRLLVQKVPTRVAQELLPALLAPVQYYSKPLAKRLSEVVAY
jgi:hypothetical protein